MKATIIVAYLALVVTACTGWIFNLLNVIHSPAISQWAGQHIIRAIGVFMPPLGAIMGFVS